MNFSETISTLKNASAFELYRLRAAIDRVLDQPGWMDAVRSRLRVGQPIQYFDPGANRSQQGQVVDLRRKQAVVLDLATQKRWLISYAAINLDGADVEIREKPRKGLGRNEVAIGDVVGFLDRDLQQRSGWIDAKLHTRCGMGACQGRTCGAAAQVLYGWVPQPARHLLSPARLSTLASAAPDFIHEPMTESTSKA